MHCQPRADANTPQLSAGAKVQESGFPYIKQTLNSALIFLVLVLLVDMTSCQVNNNAQRPPEPHIMFPPVRGSTVQRGAGTGVLGNVRLSSETRESHKTSLLRRGNQEEEQGQEPKQEQAPMRATKYADAQHSGTSVQLVPPELKTLVNLNTNPAHNTYPIPNFSPSLIPNSKPRPDPNRKAKPNVYPSLKSNPYPNLNHNPSPVTFAAEEALWSKANFNISRITKDHATKEPAELGSLSFETEFDAGDSLRTGDIISMQRYDIRRKPYAAPHDHYRCGGWCICHKMKLGNLVYAKCTDNEDIKAIPQDLPADTGILNMHNSKLRWFDINDLARYKYLRKVNLSKNMIGTLIKKSCSTQLALENLDLSQNRISSISDGALSCAPQLTILNLHENMIEKLTNNSLSGVPQLQRLHLGSNEVREIEPEAFSHFPGLKFLDLSNNTDLSFPNRYAGAFQYLTSLEVLNIQGSAPRGIYPTDVLVELPALRQLSVNGETHPFDSKLSTLQNLTKLTLGAYRHCSTENFTQSYFGGLPHLRSVKIQHCTVKDMSLHMFDNNPYLVNIELNYIRHPVKDVLKSLCGVPNIENVRSLSVTNIPRGSKLAPLLVLSEQDVACIHKMKNLKLLNLDGSYISQVTQGFALGLPSSLRTLSVRRNSLIAQQSVLFQVLIVQGSLSNLTALCEDSQGDHSLTSRTDEADSEHYLLLEPDARTQNGLQEIGELDPAEDCRSVLKEKYLDSNANTFHDLFYYGKHKYPKLTVYTAKKSFNFGQRLFGSDLIRTHVQVLNLSSTLITNWGKLPVFKMSRRIKVADLSNNRNEFIDKDFFQVNNSLEELHVSGNFLGPALSNDGRGSLLSRLSNLKFLDLSRNHLFRLPWMLFQGLPSLRVLKLVSNNIVYLDIHVAHMRSLTFVDAVKNSITGISKRTRDDLDTIAQGRNVSIDLNFNPLPCTCDGLELLNWLSTTAVRVLNKDFLTCMNEGHQLEAMGDIDLRLASLQRECISKKLLILSCSFAAAFLLLLGAGIWVFQNRWWIIYTRNRFVSSLYGYKRGKNTTGDSQFTFDAFFVYGATGCDFVLDRCLPELEGVRGHRLCVEDRDFLAGSYIPCNVTSAVRSSRRTVLVLDQRYMPEGWPHYAAQMALVEEVHAKRRVLHLLLLGSSLPEERLPPAYLKVAREGKVTEVPPQGCRPEVEREFWDALSRTIGHCDGENRRSNPLLDALDT